MPILTKEVEVKLWGNNIKHYHDLGYEGKYGDFITVKTKDLSDGSNVKIQYLCDYCEKEVITIVYADLIRRTKDVNKMACKHCSSQKVKETSLLRFGTTNYTKTEEYQMKREITTQFRYGVNHYSQTQEYKEKWDTTCKEKYGDSYRKQFMVKAFETFRNKTGYNYPSQSPEVKAKVSQTNFEKCGYYSVLQSPEIREKITQTLYTNSSQKASRQQRYICELYQGQLNFPVKSYCVDIYLLNDNLAIEFDGSGHMLNVAMGRETMEEYTQKEIVRHNVIRREGYKQMKIVSYKDLLPSDSVLLQMLSETKQYFSKYPNHSWIEFDINLSIIRNAENKDGMLYNYGKLRKIKDSDLYESTI